MTQEQELTRDQKGLARAIYQDLKQTYTSLTLDFILEEATRQINGEHPRGGPGAFLQDYFKRAGYL